MSGKDHTIKIKGGNVVRQALDRPHTPPNAPGQQQGHQGQQHQCRANDVLGDVPAQPVGAVADTASAPGTCAGKARRFAR
mgnify:CR=1 FL=1